MHAREACVPSTALGSAVQPIWVGFEVMEPCLVLPRSKCTPSCPCAGMALAKHHACAGGYAAISDICRGSVTAALPHC